MEQKGFPEPIVQEGPVADEFEYQLKPKESSSLSDRAWTLADNNLVPPLSPNKAGAFSSFAQRLSGADSTNNDDEGATSAALITPFGAKSLSVHGENQSRNTDLRTPDFSSRAVRCTPGPPKSSSVTTHRREAKRSQPASGGLFWGANRDIEALLNSPSIDDSGGQNGSSRNYCSKSPGRLSTSPCEDGSSPTPTASSTTAQTLSPSEKENKRTNVYSNELESTTNVGEPLPRSNYDMQRDFLDRAVWVPASSRPAQDLRSMSFSGLSRSADASTGLSSILAKPTEPAMNPHASNYVPAHLRNTDHLPGDTSIDEGSQSQPHQGAQTYHDSRTEPLQPFDGPLAGQYSTPHVGRHYQQYSNRSNVQAGHRQAILHKHAFSSHHEHGHGEQKDGTPQLHHHNERVEQEFLRQRHHHQHYSQPMNTVAYTSQAALLQEPDLLQGGLSFNAASQGVAGSYQMASTHYASQPRPYYQRLSRSDPSPMGPSTRATSSLQFEQHGYMPKSLQYGQQRGANLEVRDQLPAPPPIPAGTSTGTQGVISHRTQRDSQKGAKSKNKQVSGGTGAGVGTGSDANSSTTITDGKKKDWTKYRDLADKAKRLHDYDKARELYQVLNGRHPDIAAGWLEHAKMEEECGHFSRCGELLSKGIEHCPAHEGLLIKALKHFERDNDYAAARRTMKSLKGLPLTKTWKVLLEAAALEARDGNIDTARKVFKFLMNKPGVKPGPIYFEAARFEERLGEEARTVAFIQEGIEKSPRYGPLWFLAFRVWERLETRRATKADGKLASPRAFSADTSVVVQKEVQSRTSLFGGRRIHFNMKNTRWMIKLALVQVQRELLWKVYFAQGQLEERQAMAALKVAEEVDPEEPVELFFDDLASARHENLQDSSLFDEETKTSTRSRGTATTRQGGHSNSRPSSNFAPASSDGIILKPTTERVATRTTTTSLQAAAIFFQRARRAYAQAIVSCPSRLRWKVWAAGARVELKAGRPKVSRRLLQHARDVVPPKYEENVIVELARVAELLGELDHAEFDLLEPALEHSTTSWKLWLYTARFRLRRCGREAAIETLRKGLAIPTHRGAGRMWALLIQLLVHDGPAIQKATFSEAVQAAPKSGEVWCEGARLCMNPFGDNATFFDLDQASRNLTFALRFTPQYGDSFVEQLRLQILLQLQQLIQSRTDYDSFNGSRNPLSLMVKPYHIVRVCTVADPNYGDVWFHCKQNAYESVHDVFSRAKEIIAQQVWQARRIYLLAMHPGIDLAAVPVCSEDGSLLFDSDDVDGEFGWATSGQTRSAGVDDRAEGHIDRLFASAVMSVGGSQIGVKPFDKQALLRVYEADPILP